MCLRGRIKKKLSKEIAKKLEDIVVKFEYASGPDKKLYGSVTAKDISEALAKDFGIDIDKRKISLREPIKSFGRFIADVRLYTEVSGKITVEVTGKEN